MTPKVKKATLIKFAFHIFKLKVEVICEIGKTLSEKDYLVHER